MSHFDASVMQMQPKLLFDVQFHRDVDGVSFRRRNESFKVDGADSYRAMIDLAPHLTGESRVAEICTRLDPTRVEVAVGLIERLRERGFIIERTPETTLLPDIVLQRFAAQIEFLSQFAERPLQRFESFRNSRILVCGSGPAARATTLALARNGALQLLCEEQLLRTSAMGGLAEECETSHPGCSLEALASAAALSSATIGGSTLHAICYASDEPDLSAIARLSRACRARHIPFIPGMFMSGKGMVGPLCDGAARPCWFCLVMRRADRLNPPQRASVWRCLALGTAWGADRKLQYSHTSAILGNLVAFEAFKLLARHLPVEIHEHVLTFDLESLECGRSRLLPHPLCPDCSQDEADHDRHFLSTASALIGARLPIPQRLRQIAVLVDATMGIATQSDDQALPQSPLFQASVTLRERQSGNEQSELGCSLHSYGEAKLRAVRAVAGRYATGLVVPARIKHGSREDFTRLGFRVMPPSAISGCLSPSGDLDRDCTEWMYALSLEHQQTCLVPAAAVHTGSALNRSVFETVGAGTGVGHFFAEARREAIHSRLAHEALKQLAMGRRRAVSAPLPTLRHSSPDLELALTILETLQIAPRVLTVSQLKASIAIAFSPDIGSDARKVAIGTGERPQAAICSALTDLIAIAQGSACADSLEYYLPSALAYCLDVADLEAHGGGPGLQGDGLGAPEPPEIFIANLSTDDLQVADLMVVKALIAAS